MLENTLLFFSDSNSVVLARLTSFPSPIDRSAAWLTLSEFGALFLLGCGGGGGGFLRDSCLLPSAGEALAARLGGGPGGFLRGITPDAGLGLRSRCSILIVRFLAPRGDASGVRWDGGLSIFISIIIVSVLLCWTSALEFASFVLPRWFKWPLFPIAAPLILSLEARFTLELCWALSRTPRTLDAEADLTTAPLFALNALARLLVRARTLRLLSPVRFWPCAGGLKGRFSWWLPKVRRSSLANEINERESGILLASSSNSERFSPWAAAHFLRCE
mmetsp:Transcript_7676/g.18722  ORF Transcript_7676/g.18722 Transcript_7676/m.18722 type:complete len:275 (-) Transcript_7676:358-1182(-)